MEGKGIVFMLMDVNMGMIYDVRHPVVSSTI